MKDLLAELRERHLMPVVALLIAGIAAVPFLVRSDAAPATPETALGAVIKQTPELESVVAAETPVLRDFRQRLRGRASKNPFKPAVPIDTGSGATGTGDTGGLQTGGAETPTGSVTEPAASTAPPGDEGSGEVENPGNGGGAGNGDGAGSDDDEGEGGDGEDPTPAPPPPPEDRLITYEIDVAVGEVGRGGLNKVRKVETLDFLPGNNRPVVQYITSDLDGTRASFVVSNAVIGARGNGQCAPSADACQFLFLTPGQEERLTYDVDGITYRLKLLRIHRIETPLAEVTNFANTAYASVVEG